MAMYADQVIETQLFQQYDYMVHHEGVSESDITLLKGLVLAVADAVGPDLDRIRMTFKQYTEHDMRHLCNVADLVFRLLPKKKNSARSDVAKVRLNAVELTFLWLGILLHDIGMSVTDSEKAEAWTSDDFHDFASLNPDKVKAAENARKQGRELRARAIEDALLAEYFRRLHPDRARSYIQDVLGKKNLLVFHNLSVLDDVADLCESHAWGVRESRDPRVPQKCLAALDRNRRLYSFRVNLRYIACCLRLGDVLDFDISRTPLTVYEEIDFTEPESIKEWNKHLSIRGWQIDEHRILFDASCTHPAFYVAVHDFLNMVDLELRECRYLIDDAPSGDEEKYVLYLAHLVDRRQVRMSDKRFIAGGFRFQLEYEEIMRLLMDKSLYPDSTLFMRELLQNGLDACRYQKALAEDARMGDKYIPRIQIWDYTKDLEEPRIIFQDNGIGMSLTHVETYFLRVGKSFYRSSEFITERQRLMGRGITLDACSQFGIGFLSCFLGGDKIEVETWRYGNIPLTITITGPSKYFLIEQMPAAEGVIPFRSPVAELEDRPPSFPGTRITVYLKDGWHKSKELDEGVVYKTLDAFAANQEFDINIYDGSKKEPRKIKRRRWDNADPPLCMDLNKSLLHLPDFLAPAVYNLNSFSKELRGKVAIWMLRSSEDTACPYTGDLSLSRSSIVVMSVEIRLFEDVCSFVDLFEEHYSEIMVDAVIQHLIKSSPNMKKFKESLNFFEEEEDIYEIEKFAKSFRVKIKSCNTEQRRELIALCNIITRSDRNYSLRWYESREFMEALATGNRDRLVELMVEIGIPDFEEELNFSSTLSVSLFGINIPGNIILWNPAQGHAQQIQTVPEGVSASVDAYGSLAPQPSASRLFIHDEESGILRGALGRAVLNFSASLYESNRSSFQWKKWYEDFLASCGPIQDAALEKLREIQKYIQIICSLEGKYKLLTPLDVCHLFGVVAPVVDEKEMTEKDGIFLHAYHDGYFQSWLVSQLPVLGLQDGTQGLDLTALHKKLEIESR